MPALFNTRTRLLASVGALYCASFLSPSQAFAQAAPVQESGDSSPQTLPAVTVNATAVQSDMQVKALPSYKFTAPLLDTPRSITVIPEELIRQTNATTFADALKTVPGITFLGGDAAANPSADRPVIRGFESRNSIFVDGIRDSGVQNRETFDIENITVIKGPDSVYAGRGAVGGSIDIETKMPKNENFITGSAGIGTDAYKRLTLDVNQKFAGDNAFRFNAMGFDANQAGRNNVYSKRWGVAPSVAFGLNSPTTVTLSYYDDSMPTRRRSIGARRPIGELRSPQLCGRVKAEKLSFADVLGIRGVTALSSRTRGEFRKPALRLLGGNWQSPISPWKT